MIEIAVGRRRRVDGHPGHALQRDGERLLGILERHSVLRPRGTRDARLDRAEIELDDIGVDRIISVSCK